LTLGTSETNSRKCTAKDETGAKAPSKKGVNKMTKKEKEKEMYKQLCNMAGIFCLMFKIFKKLKHKKPIGFYRGKWTLEGGEPIKVENMSGRQAREAVKHAEKIIWNKIAEINFLQRQKDNILKEIEETGTYKRY